MIFPLASQSGIEVKAVHRFQDPERDGIASSVSQSEGTWGESVLALPCQQYFKTQTMGRELGRREVRGIPQRCTLHPSPSEGCCVGRRWSTLLASVSSQRDSPQGSGKKETEQSCNQEIKSLSHKSVCCFFFFKSFFERQPKKVPSHSQLYATFKLNCFQRQRLNSPEPICEAFKPAAQRPCFILFLFSFLEKGLKGEGEPSRNTTCSRSPRAEIVRQDEHSDGFFSIPS